MLLDIQVVRGLHLVLVWAVAGEIIAVAAAASIHLRIRIWSILCACWSKKRYNNGCCPKEQLRGLWVCLETTVSVNTL